MTVRISAFFKSLSSRLLLLTLLWVSFIVSSIGYTMLLNWELEASAAAKSTVDELRFHAIETAVRARDANAFDEEVRRTEELYGILREGDQWVPIVLPRDENIQRGLETIQELWRTDIMPLLFSVHLGKAEPDTARIAHYTDEVAALSKKIDDYRAVYLWQLRYLQILLIILAIGSLFVIMALLLRWVIRPVERIGTGIRALSAGDLSARVNARGEDEIARIAKGFNQMADKLEDLYENLEQKVVEKTASVEEKNRHLAQLYEITSFFSRRWSIEEMTEGFVERLIRFSSADGCLLTFVDEKNDRYHIAASHGLSDAYLERFGEGAATDSMTMTVLSKNYPVCCQLETSPLEELRELQGEGFVTGYCFQVRHTVSNIGTYCLFFRHNPELTTQVVQLIESFATHLGVAIANARLTERERQYAVVEERQLLARGLHDSIAQALSFLNLQVQFLADAIATKDDPLRDESLDAIRTGVQECYEDVRELLLNFRERLHKGGFVEGVRTVVQRFEAQSHIPARLVVNGKGGELSERQQLQAIFIIQEALSNVRKHSEAENVDIRIDNREDLVVTIVDDGIGIREEVVQAKKARHVGLSIMAERASRIGARVQVGRASPIGGTRVTLTLPSEARGES